MLEDIAKWGLCPMIVSFKTLINGYCKSGDLKEGFRLKRVMEESGMHLDAFTYNVLINGLCKESKLDDANRLFDKLYERIVPNDFFSLSLLQQNFHGGIVTSKVSLS